MNLKITPEAIGHDLNELDRLLKELRAEGKAKEITGQKKYTRWVRTEIRIKPGEEV